MNPGSVPVPYPGALSVAEAAALIPGTIMPTADYAAATHVTNEMTNLRWRGVMLIIDINNVNTTGDITLKLQTFDGTTWVDIPDAVSANLTSAGVTTLTLHPGADEDANVHISTQLPLRWRISVTVADAIVNFSVVGFYLP
jgi:hypothetical protein